MLIPSKSKPARGPQKPAAQFTSNQLIIAICVFLIVALICFCLGVLVGRYETASTRVKEARSVEPLLPAAPPQPLPKRETPLGPEGVQESPRPVVMPFAPAKTPGFPGSPTGGTTAPGPRSSEHPAPPKPAAPTGATASGPPAGAEAASKPVQEEKPGAKPESAPAAEAASPVAAPSPAQPAPPVSAPGAPPEPSKPAETAAPAPTTPEEKTKEVLPVPAAPSLPPVPAKPEKAEASKAPKGTYSIQVAAFSGPNRQKAADEYKRRLEANSDLKAELVAFEDNHVRLFVGNYPDKDTADKACAELKKRAGFADSFVRRR
jgi:hypothetical protein